MTFIPCTNLAALSLAVVSLTGCSSRPPGVSQAAWDAMSPSAQADYRRHREQEDRRARQLFDDHQRSTNEAIRAVESRVTKIGND